MIYYIRKIAELFRKRKEVHKMASVYNVAAYIISKCGEITTMKLQKLTYYCQAWSLAWDDKPLFDEDFEAWANGPVCPELFNKHRGQFVVGKNFLPEYLDYDFTDNEIETMDVVLNDLKDKSPQWLSDLTHSERPWKDARKGYAPGEPCSEVISKEDMRQYYGGLLAIE